MATAAKTNYAAGPVCVANTKTKTFSKSRHLLLVLKNTILRGYFMFPSDVYVVNLKILDKYKFPNVKST